MRKQDTFIEVDEAMELLGVGRSKAYAILRQCNLELAAMGLMTFRGKCPRRYLYKKIYGLDEAYHPWASIFRASDKTQKPILREALRTLRSAADVEDVTEDSTISTQRCLIF